MADHALTNLVFREDCLEKAGREKAFADIFEAYYKRIFNYIYYRVYSHHTSEDLTSQVFEKVMRKLDTYTQGKSPFEVWLFAIARNVVNDHFRGRKRHSLLSLDTIGELVSRRKDPEGIVIRGETSDSLSRALSTLDARERNIIALKFGAGLKNREIAELLKLKENNVGVVLYRSMKKLKNEMESEGQP